MPEEELSLLKKTPLWEHMVALAPQSLREWEELAKVRLTVDRYRNLAVPVLLLTGSDTRDHPSFATDALQGILPNARTAVLDGHGHGAHLSAPDLVAREVTSVLPEGPR